MLGGPSRSEKDVALRLGDMEMAWRGRACDRGQEAARQASRAALIQGSPDPGRAEEGTEAASDTAGACKPQPKAGGAVRTVRTESGQALRHCPSPPPNTHRLPYPDHRGLGKQKSPLPPALPGVLFPRPRAEATPPSPRGPPSHPGGPPLTSLPTSSLTPGKGGGAWRCTLLRHQGVEGYALREHKPGVYLPAPRKQGGREGGRPHLPLGC